MHGIDCKKFDPARCTNMHSLLIIGKRGTGKTVLVKDLMKTVDYTETFLIGDTDFHDQRFPSTRSEYNGLIPEENIYDDYTESVVDGIIVEQQKCLRIAKMSQDCKEGLQKCVIFENCFFDKFWMNHKGMKFLYLNGPCNKLNHIIVMQYPLKLNPVFIANTDYVFIFRDNLNNLNNLNNLKRMYDQFGQMFRTFDDFCQALEQITANPFTCMVLSLNPSSNHLSDQVFWYKATSIN